MALFSGLLGRPSGPSHAIGYADPRPGDHSPGFGACEEDGRGVGPARFDRRRTFHETFLRLSPLDPVVDL